MTWTAYVDSLKAYYPDGAGACGIFGMNGSTWAQEGLDHAQTNYQELINLNGLFENPSEG